MVLSLKSKLCQSKIIPVIMKKPTVFLCFLLAVCMAFTPNHPADNGLKVGTFAPSFKLKDNNDKDVSLSSYKGKVVLIYFWASWCKQCRSESPRLVKAYEKYRNANFENGN